MNKRVELIQTNSANGYIKTENEIIALVSTKRPDKCFLKLKEVIDVYNDAIDRDNPQPLTLEQLREMDGEPVWTTYHDGSEARWGIVTVGEYGIGAIVDELSCYWYWLDIGLDHPHIAYKHKPKEV